MPEQKGDAKPLRVVVNFDKDTWLRVRHAALDAGQPMSEIVKELLLKWVAEQEGQSTRNSVRRRK